MNVRAAGVPSMLDEKTKQNVRNNGLAGGE